MKKQAFLKPAFAMILMLWLVSCSPVKLTSWVNPGENRKFSKVLVWGMFEKTAYVKPFEHTVAAYLDKNGIQAVESGSILDPGKKYDKAVLKHKFDSLGVDAVLMVTYTSSEKRDAYQSFSPSWFPGYYGGYYGYYGYSGWDYPYFGTWYPGLYPDGYWTKVKVVNLKANLYKTSDSKLLWSGDIQVDDPQYVKEVSKYIACAVVADWKKYQLMQVKNEK